MPTPTSGSPASEVPFSGNPQIDGLLIGDKWGGALGTGVIVGYSFPDADSVWSTVPSDPNGYDPSDPANDNPFASQYHGLNGTQQDAVRISLAEWGQVANLVFAEVPETASAVGDIRVAFTDGGGMLQNYYAYAYTPDPYAYAGDVWLNSVQPVASGNDFSPGAAGYNTLIHELGHAIGLGHPFELQSFPAQFDSFKYSVMSYSDSPGHQDAGDSSLYPTTPMLLDIQALQYLYGANTAWHAGDDTYTFTEGGRYYETIWDAGGTDTIQYDSAADGARIDLRAGNFSQLGQPITLSSGALQHDDVAIAFSVVIENATGGDGDDVLIGNAAANILTGAGGNDALMGEGGDDWLEGGAGNDAMAGGPGDDSYVAEGADVITEAAGAGFDTVRSAASYVLAAANVEAVRLTGSDNIDATGNALGNALTGNDGNNVLDGGAGSDAMAGGDGDDSYYVNAAGDSVIETNPAGGEDHVYSRVGFALGANLEFLTLAGTAAVNAIGNELDNVLAGNGAANLLDGGAGNDAMAGGAGNDRYAVDSAADSVTELAGGGTDRVDSSVSWTLGENLENLLLTGTDDVNATGNAGNNVLTGNAGDNVLDGGAGNDTMAGGAGNDTYILIDSGDLVVETGGGNDTIVSAISMSLIGAAAGVENLTLLAKAGAASATGNGEDNVLIGNRSDNVLTGGAGNDLLFGGQGNDLMAGGAGNDTYDVNRGDGAGTAKLAPFEDSVVEGLSAGIDTVLSRLQAYSLDANVENLVLEGGGRKGYGNALANAMTGNARSNTLDGGAGDDVLEGGAGDDRLTGGAGNDSFAFDGLDRSVDRILDYSVANDSLQLSLAGFAGIGAVGSFDASTFVSNGAPAALDANQHILYNSATGALYYDADGDGPGAAVQFAALSGAPALSAAEFAVIA